MPRGVDVGVQVLLGGLAGADPIAGVVVAEDVAVDPRAQAEVEAAHVSQIRRVAVREEDAEARVRRAAHKHARDFVPAVRAGVENLDGLLLLVRELPLGLLRQVQAVAGACLVGGEGVGGFGRDEGHFSRYAGGARRPAEETADISYA